VSDANGLKDEGRSKSVRRREAPEASLSLQYLVAASVVLGVTLPMFFLGPIIGYRSVALLYLLAVVMMALVVGRGPTLLAATMSALLWNFCFVAPVASLRISNVEDGILFATYFVVALVLGQLIAQARAKEKAYREGEERATALYELTRDLDAATSLDQLLEEATQHMEQAFCARVALLLPDTGGQLSLHPHPASTCEIAGPEQPAADWSFRQGRPSGRYSEHLPETDIQFVPLIAGERTIGVIGLRYSETGVPTQAHRNLLEAFAQHIAFALDRHQLREQTGQLKLVAESERLGRVLLNSMSHEIRTPLSAIKSAASTLAELNDAQLSSSQKEMVAEIQEAIDRLDGLVGKVLDIARLEAGRVKPKISLCDVTDLIHVALKETRKQLARHKVAVEVAPGLPLIRADFVLLQQALMNLMSNAAIHTPPGTSILIRASVREGALAISVGDGGPGIPPEALARVFDKFYRAPGAPTGGTGLGLSLVKGFVEAQGGQVSVENRFGGGSLFTIRLPLNQSHPELARTS
jgi:two-component system sensor histidine kinase KdpD